MVFAVDSEKKLRIMAGELRRLISDVFDFVDDIKVVISEGVQGKYTFEVSD
jgi:hypothetical protein